MLAPTIWFWKRHHLRSFHPLIRECLLPRHALYVIASNSAPVVQVLLSGAPWMHPSWSRCEPVELNMNM